MRRVVRARLVAASVVLLAVLAGCARVVDGQGSPVPRTASGGGPSFPSQSGAPSPSPTAAPTTAPSGSAATCPTITDATTRLRFGCLTTAMINQAAGGYNVNIVKQTQANPNWYISQSTLVVSAANATELASSVDSALSDFLNQFFPAGSSGKVTAAKSATVGGRPALMVSGVITIDKSDPQYTNLKAKTDHIVTLAVLRGDGTAGMLILDVPDTRADLFPAMTTVATNTRLI